jgi:hypothetical protein
MEEVTCNVLPPLPGVNRQLPEGEVSNHKGNFDEHIFRRMLVSICSSHKNVILSISWPDWTFPGFSIIVSRRWSINDFGTLHSAWTAKVNFAYASWVGGGFRRSAFCNFICRTL